MVYAIERYCHDCFDEVLATYEETNTATSEMTGKAFRALVAQEAREHDWFVYGLVNSHLVPRGLPNTVLIRGEDLLFHRVVGDVSVRLRPITAMGLPSHRMLVSPAVPEEVERALRRMGDDDPLPSTVAFLYMDEKYIDAGTRASMQVTSLVGLLIGAEIYPLFRDSLFRLLPGFDAGAMAFASQIHASDLFRDRPEEEHFAFYEGLVSLVNETGCKVYRRGVNFVPSDKRIRQNQQQLIGRCFKAILIAVDDAEVDAQIWPVMEVDHSEEQDENFAGYVRWMDQTTVSFEMTVDGVVAELIDDDYMVDTRRFGDLHYVSKRSVVGSAADCLLYLLHCKWLYDQNLALTDYKKRLAEIASLLQPELVDDYIACYRAHG